MKPAWLRAGLAVAAAGTSALLARSLRDGPWAIVPILALGGIPGYAIAVRLGVARPLALAPGLGIGAIAILAGAAGWAGLPAWSGVSILVLGGAAAWALAPRDPGPRPPGDGSAIQATDSIGATGPEGPGRAHSLAERAATALAFALAIGVGLASHHLLAFPRLVQETSFVEPLGRALDSISGQPGGPWPSRLPAVLAPLALLSLFALGERLFASGLAGLITLFLGIDHLGVLGPAFNGILGLPDPCGFAAYILVPLAILLIFPAEGETRRPRTSLRIAQFLCLFALARVQPFDAIPLALGLLAAAFAGGSQSARRAALAGLLVLGAAALVARVFPGSVSEPHRLVHPGWPGAELKAISPGLFYVDPLGAVGLLYLTLVSDGPAIGLASILLLPIVVISRRTAVGPAFLAGALLGPLIGILLQPTLAPAALKILTRAGSCLFFEWAAAMAIVSAAGGAWLITDAACAALQATSSMSRRISRRQRSASSGVPE